MPLITDQQIAVSAEMLGQGFVTGIKQQQLDDPHSGPDRFAEEYADPSSIFPDHYAVISAAKVILVNEIAKDPTLRKGMRQTFRDFGVVTVRPTDRGAQTIDELHPYNVSHLHHILPNITD